MDKKQLGTVSSSSFPSYSQCELGSFYTTRKDEIFKDVFEDFQQYYNNGLIYEPCCGNGDIINYLNNHNIHNIEDYDIVNNTVKNSKIQDTILKPLNYDNCWIITNPPYLAKNKMTKEMKQKYNFKDVDDLYEFYILQLVESDCLGGILILPSNFLFSYSNKVRKQFIEKYEIKILKIYEKQIFDDTTSSVIVFNFIKRELTNFNIKTQLIQKEKTETFIIELSKDNNYIYGYELYKEKYESNIKLFRFVNNDLGEYYKTNIEIFTLDPKMKAVYNKDPQINKITDRSKINIIINRKLKDGEQRYIINKFNERLNKIENSITHYL